jgi:hypothetical protein
MEPERAGSSEMLVTIYQATLSPAKKIQAARASEMLAAIYIYTVALPEECILNIHFLSQKIKIGCSVKFLFPSWPLLFGGGAHIYTKFIKTQHEMKQKLCNYSNNYVNRRLTR